MRKNKLLIPIIASSSLACVFACSISSCSSEQMPLSEAKSKSIGQISEFAYSAMARQPESINQIIEARDYAIIQVNKSSCWQQAYALSSSAMAMDAIARQPEIYPIIRASLIFGTNIILTQQNNKSLALGQALGIYNPSTTDQKGLYSAVSRQPEISSKLFLDFISFAYNLIND